LSDAVLKQEYLNYLKWTEPIALMLALVDDARAVWLVQLALDVDLMLGSRLAGEVQPVVLQKEAVTSVIKEIRKQQVSPTYEIQLLGNTHSDYAVPILLEKLTDDENQNLIFESAFALRELGSQSAIQKLLPLLGHQNQRLVIASLFVLGKLGNEEILPDLQQVLKYTDESIREQAVETLGELGSNTALLDLHEALKDSSSRVREKAIEALGKLGDESVLPELIKIAVEDYAISVEAISLRWTSAKVLGQINPEKASEELFKVLKDEENDEIRQNAAEALGKVGSETAIEPLIAALQDISIAWKVAKALLEIGSKKAVPGLIKALEHSVPCEQAAFALGEIGDDLAVPALINALNHWYPQVREQAVEALGNISDRKAIPKLYELYETLQKDSRNDLKRKVVIALGKLGDGRVRQELLRILDTQVFGSTLYRYDWWKVFEALEKIGDNSVILALIQVLLRAQNPQNRWKAAEALGNLGDEAAIDSLFKALEDNNSTVQWKSAEALGKFKSQQLIPKIFSLLAHQEEPNIRQAAVQVLGYLEDEFAVTALLEALNDLEPIVRYDVAQSLVKLSSSKVKLSVSKALGHFWKSKLLNDGFLHQVRSLKENCKFYNYEIWHEAMQNSNLELKNAEQGTEVGQTTTIFNIKTLNAPNAALNLGGTIHGDQTGTQRHPPKS
jgi:HEAT repeat protein